MKDVRLLVAGGRAFGDDHELDRVLSRIHASIGIAYLIQGEAPGADTLAKGWAHSKRIPVSDEFHANWALLGNRGGHARNQRMLDEGRPDFAVTFPGGEGTKDMKQRLLRARIPFMWAEAHAILGPNGPLQPLYIWKRM